MGHDLRAAAAMGQLRSIVRSLAWSGDEPHAVVARADELTRALDIATLATCAYGVVCVHEDATCTVTYTLAGHPPAIIRHPDGRIERLEDAVTSPLGVTDSRDVPQASADLPVGAYLILYTDGLVERPGIDIDEGLQALARVIGNARDDSTADELCTRIVAELTNGQYDDDVCVLVLRRLA